MDAAVAHIMRPRVSSGPAVDPGRVRDILLVRLAVEDKALTREAVAREIGAFANMGRESAQWLDLVARAIAGLADAGLVDAKPVGVAATDAGRKRAVLILGARGGLPKSWRIARDQHLIAKALGIEGDSPRRLRLLLRPDGLRALIVCKAFNLKVRGVPTPSRVRAALAALALERAFAGLPQTEVGRKTGLSAKAGRALAGRLSRRPQDYRTDSRLLAALAAEYTGAAKGDAAALQLALLRTYVRVDGGAALDAAPTRARRTVKASRRRRGEAATPPPPSTAAPTPVVAPPVPVDAKVADHVAAAKAPARPDVSGFAAEVRRHAELVAEGWSGNRKAWVSRVWRALAGARPDWGLSEIEFKCMLAEAHRVGAVVLANADLKDGRNLKDVQESALSYKNAVFHYVRVED